MSRKSQTALEHYITRRGGNPAAAAAGRKNPAIQWKHVRILVLLTLLAGVAWPLLPHRTHPLRLTYEIDLSSAPEGTLVITMLAEGKLPGELDLEFPPGVFGDQDNGVSISAPTAHVINEDGSRGHHLIIDRIADGWRLQTEGAGRAGFIYNVDLSRTRSLETDIRRYISTPVSGGVRAAGFEIFLEPVGVLVEDITVAVHNPDDLPLLVPWPALVRGGQLKTPEIPEDHPPVQDAHLGLGQGFRPALPDDGSYLADHKGKESNPALAPVPASLFYHPLDLADLNNSLLICGDIRTLSAQARDCVIQYATDRNWYFDDQRVMDLVRKIARTEMGFFGSAPTDQITVILAANEVNSPDGFDIYGVHTGSSVLVLIGQETTWGILEEQAASVIAHEMFHGWLGEAIPQADPATLWFTEGATTWYAARMLAAAGVWAPAHGRQVIEDRVARDYARSDMLGHIPVAEAAGQVMASGEVVRFAYAGGVAACMGLDEMLRQATGMKAPLDLVLRQMYQGRTGEPLSREMLEKTVLDLTGVDCSAWLDEYVYGTRALGPVAEQVAVK